MAKNRTEPPAGHCPADPEPPGLALPGPASRHFLPYQAAWLRDQSPLRIIEKSRQIGMTYTDAYDSVIKVSPLGARLDVWISSRDHPQAKLYLEDAKRWASLLSLVAIDIGEVILDDEKGTSAYVLQFASGCRIYSLSSNPNALAGKRGHVKIDEFALHQDQRLLYRIAKPVTMWGGSLSVISTHRGVGTVFNQIIRDIRETGNPMGWSLHSVPIQAAVDQGLVERINAKTGRDESREAFLRRLRAECIDEEQWLQEYCCIPADESAAFITHDMITACEDPNLRLHAPSEFLSHFSKSHFSPTLQDSSTPSASPLFLGLDVARKHDLCVIDVGEKIGDVTWDRLRIELRDEPFSAIEAQLYRLLELPQLHRACIDATGLGMQLAERARERFGWKVEPVTFTAHTKEELAFGLRRDFQDCRLRICRDEALRTDLRSLKKLVTPAGNLRFAGETEDHHCDRTWAKALRQHAARTLFEIGAVVG